MNRKITRAQIRTVAIRLVQEQNGICPLCLKPLELGVKGSVVVDHDHSTGRIRGALHRSCNSGEGKAFNAVGRWIAGRMDYELVVPALERLVHYLKQEPTSLIYHDHKTTDEKNAIRAARERKRRAERKAAIAVKRGG